MRYILIYAAICTIGSLILAPIVPAPLLAADGIDAAADPSAASYSSSIVCFSETDGYFPLSAGGRPAPLHVSADDDPGVIRAMRDLQDDLRRVTGSEPALSTESIPGSHTLVIAGTAGRNQTIDRLVDAGVVDVSVLEGRWETFVIKSVDNPLEGVERALVIVGSDKRGTIYGIYELSRQIGVSPWYYWADVPISRNADLYVAPEPFTLGEPAVQYRGIFINNENPALYGWVNHTFGGFNHTFYEKVFELILRLRGNYLWPAMWGKAFHDDDPKNAELADMYGVVIGYTHHEPMMRAHVEWARYGNGKWDYQTNAEVLREFWREGIERMGTYESSVTLGMRGDGDEPMTAEANIELLERIVNDQRQILRESARQGMDEFLQIWALYKEVQEYYEQGMEVPDDVMILLANDNWGNVRLLPDPDTAHERAGGWGMYYHFDYVGGPRNYKWINTIQISRIWEQMHLTYRHGVDRMWLVNVGDIKPMEYPISFFLDFAWNPDILTIEKMADYPRWWAKQQFGAEYAEEIGYLLTEYTRFNSRRKPELLSPDTYSLVHFREAERVVEEYNALAENAQRIHDRIPEEYRDAFFQLVLYPVKAAANLNELYVTVARNRMYAEQGRTATNELAGKALRHFKRNTELDERYHHDIAEGKWIHMMSQTRIGYSFWQQPPWDRMPDVRYITPREPAGMGVFAEGSPLPALTYAAEWTPQERLAAMNELELPAFDAFNRQSYYFEIFNQGRTPFTYSIQSSDLWLEVSETGGRIETERRVWVSVDWNRVPEGNHRASLRIIPEPIDAPVQTGPVRYPVMVYADVLNPPSNAAREVDGFIEGNGYVSIEAPHFTRAINADDAHWQMIPDLGRTHSSMTPFPVTAERRTPGSDDTPRLEYDLYLFSAGEVTVRVYLSPTKNYTRTEGLRYAVSFNDDEPQIVNMHEEMINGFSTQVWGRWVANNINVRSSVHTIDEPGKHVLKLWMVDPGVVVQKIVVQTGEVGETYLGPPESFRNEAGGHATGAAN
jgi:hypothetical protein